jgi:outer membrane biogenesis lipoprotein LolB
MRILMLLSVSMALFGCSRQSRFQQTSSPTIMFDTKTSQDCSAAPKHDDDGKHGYPYCSDLK